MLKDISLLPESEPLGLLNRKPAVEIISQLKQYSQGSSESLRSRGILLDGKRGSGKVSFPYNFVFIEFYPKSRFIVGTEERLDGYS